MQSPRSEVARLTSACAHCRDKKIKCSGGNPCKTCRRQQKDCSYPISRRGKRARIETGLRRILPEPHAETSVWPPTPSYTSSDICEEQVNEASSTFSAAQQAVTSLGLLSPIQLQPPPFGVASAGGAHVNGGVLEHQDDEDSVIPLHKVNWEHHGPCSWASICSQPGIMWVRERSGSDEFVDIANGLTRTWSQRLKMKRVDNLPVKNFSEPDEATAWAYVAAYFEHSYDAVFGVVHRPTFESRLRAHFRLGNASRVDDPSWYALRNIVYAAGCRSLLAKDSNLSFVEAAAKSRQYFQTALSVFNAIIFGRSGFTAIQALLLMGIYAEGLGSPALEYPIAINAVQLALARGLHRAPSRSWNLAEADALSRSWLWWAVYCLEKMIVMRCGRPSIIDDDNISTPIPSKAPPGSSIDVEVFRLMIEHAQIASQISRRIMSVKAFRQSFDQTKKTVDDIQPQLEKLLESLPPRLQTNSNVPSPCQLQSIYLYFAIWGSLMATHIIFFYPWIAARFGPGNDSAIQAQIRESSTVVANAARQIILVLRSVTTDAATPSWLAFYYPIYAHTNLLVYVLMDPSRKTAMGDLALLDISAGHFGHVEHTTDAEVAFHYPRDTAALCSRIIKTSWSVETANEAAIPITPQLANITSLQGFGGETDASNFASNISAACMPSGLPFEDMEFDMESFNIFSSIDVTNDIDMTLASFPNA